MNRNHVVSKAVFALTCWLALPLVASPLAASGGDQLFMGIDAIHGFGEQDILSSGSDFEDFRAQLDGPNFTPVPLVSFEAADLAGLDVVALKLDSGEEVHPLSGQEIDDLHSFVADGGSLLVLAEGGKGADVDNLNELSSFFGVVFTESASQPGGYDVIGFEDHPLTEGVAVLGVDFHRRISAFQEPALDLTTLSGEDDVLAAISGTGRAGNVVMVSDSSIWSDDDSGAERTLSFGDNMTLLTNVRDFLFGPPLELSVSGSCPGVLTLRVKGATANGSLGLLASAEIGEDEIAGGSCIGQHVELVDPRVLNSLATDDQGMAEREILVGQDLCTSALQALDLTSCRTSAPQPITPLVSAR